MQLLNNFIDKAFPQNYPVVFLHAHPDDESFLSAGLINKLISTGRECVIVYSAAALVSGQQKTVIRQSEAKAASGCLGIKTILYLDFCEPQYKNLNARPLVQQKIDYVIQNLLNLLKNNKINGPFILISYDENGGYGNKDHKLVNLVGRQLYTTHADVVPILYEVTLHREKVILWLEEAKLRLDTDSIPKLSYWVDNFGLTGKEIDYRFELNDIQLSIKREALATHISQMHNREFPLCLSNKDFSNFFGEEFLKIVVFEPNEFYGIEKKYTVRDLPFSINLYKSTEILQGYISVDDNGNEDRIRSKDGKYYQTITKGNGLIRKSMDNQISKELFDELWSKTKNKRISKSRYYIPYNSFIIELDVFHEELEGFILAEVEFSSKEISEGFEPPLWLAEDVTNNKMYRNQSLAINGIFI